jgi:hypothetical protein
MIAARKRSEFSRLALSFVIARSNYPRPAEIPQLQNDLCGADGATPPEFGGSLCHSGNEEGMSGAAGLIYRW